MLKKQLDLLETEQEDLTPEKFEESMNKQSKIARSRPLKIPIPSKKRLEVIL